MFLLSRFVGLENPFVWRIELKLNVVAKSFVLNTLIEHKTQLSSVEFLRISAEHFCVVNVREKLRYLYLPLLERIGKWLDKLVEKKA